MKVEAGNVTVRLYSTPTTVNGTTYPCWAVTWLDEAGRQRKRFSDEAKAKAFADSKAELLDKGYKFHLTTDQIAAYNRAHDTALPTGRTLEQLATEAAEAHTLAPGIKLPELARFWSLHHAGLPLTPTQVLALLLEAKRHDGLSADYLSDLKTRLGRFARDVTIPLPDITSADLAAWLARIPGSPRSRRNYRGALAALFAFAAERNIVRKDWNELPARPRQLATAPPIQIYTPAELAKLLAAAARHTTTANNLLPTLLLAAFAGIRTREIQRLDWAQVGKEWIEVNPKRTRTSSRRLVPINPTLAAWLKHHRQPSGPVCPYNQIKGAFSRLAARAKVPWKRNALRHSFISYRVAIVKNVSDVALDCGNSAAMIFQHYRERVTPAAARQWFALRPKSVPKKRPHSRRPA